MFKTKKLLIGMLLMRRGVRKARFKKKIKVYSMELNINWQEDQIP